MKHLTMVFGAPPHPGMMPPQSNLSPFFKGWDVASVPKVAAPSHEATATAPNAEATSPSLWLGAEALPTGPLPSQPPSSIVPPPSCPPPAASTSGSSSSTAEGSSTPPTLPTVAEDDDDDDDLPAIPVPSEAMAAEAAAALASAISGGTGSDAPLGQLPTSPPRALSRHGSLPAVPEASAPAAPAATFKLTLRRADNVPLGLDIRTGEEDKCLVVEAVRPGGAVEAWNRQCAGDMREIRAGDRIVNINGSEDAETMRKECLDKHLLRMTVMCGGGRAQPASVPATVSPQSLGLRADAVEFVPGSL